MEGYQHSELRPGANAERSSVSTTSFQEFEKSEMFNKAVRKDCRHVCNHFTSGPQAFMKALDSGKKLAQSVKKCHALVLVSRNISPCNTQRNQHSKVNSNNNNNIPNWLRSWGKEEERKSKTKQLLGFPIVLQIILSAPTDQTWQIAAEMFTEKSASTQNERQSRI